MSSVCFPMRPSWGPRPVTRPGWIAQAKVNGWRALLHVGSGELWSRQLTPLPCAHRWQEAVNALRAQFLDAPDAWIDAECMGVRTRGVSLIVLDAIMPGTLMERRQWLEARAGASLIPQDPDPEVLIHMGQRENQRLGEMIFEGVVVKDESSPYWMQNESAGIECQSWRKWRFS